MKTVMIKMRKKVIDYLLFNDDQLNDSEIHFIKRTNDKIGSWLCKLQ